MIKKIYYVENTDELEFTLALIMKHFYCTVLRESVEMNCSKIEIFSKGRDLEEIDGLMNLIALE